MAVPLRPLALIGAWSDRGGDFGLSRAACAVSAAQDHLSGALASILFEMRMEKGVRFGARTQELVLGRKFNLPQLGEGLLFLHLVQKQTLTIGEKPAVADDLLLSIRPRHMDKILRGTKRVEIRRKFSSKWLGHVVNLYASGPVRQLVGRATVSRVVCRAPELIWTEFGGEIGCSREEFDQYTAGADEIYALELSEVIPFRVPVSRYDMTELLQSQLVPPQSYCTVEKGKSWAKAISLAALLQGAFTGRWLRSRPPVEATQRPLLRCQGRVLSFQMRRMFI